METVRRNAEDGQPRPSVNGELLAELRAIRREQSLLRQLLNEFCGEFLNARFPYGRATDRWARRRRA